MIRKREKENPPQEARAHTYTLRKFWVRVLLFGLLLSGVLAYTLYVLTPKKDYGICSMVNLYRQKRDSVDVLTIGTSAAYAGVNTNVLWSEYGIASYDLCSAEQPYWISYYVLREALKTQHPKLVLLDAKAAVYNQDYTKRGRLIMSTYGILGPDNRIGAIKACVKDQNQVPGYLFGFAQIHSNYQKVTWSDFILPPTNGGRGGNWKGFIEIDQTEPHERPSFVATSMKQNMNEKEEEYVRKIFKLCREKGIEIALISIPNPDYASDHKFMNSLWAVAQEYGVEGLNYNDPDLRFGLHYSKDFADWQHLNVSGSITFSRKLGSDLKEKYDLPDRRGDEAYRSYDLCADSWYEQFASEEE